MIRITWDVLFERFLAYHVPRGLHVPEPEYAVSLQPREPVTLEPTARWWRTLHEYRGVVLCPES